MSGYFGGLPPPLQLCDLGQIVYMANSRGTKYSHNTKVADKKSEAYWNFDFTDMGKYDVPALLHSVFEISSVNVLTKYDVVGYDVGNMQYFYALT